MTKSIDVTNSAQDEQLSPEFEKMLKKTIARAKIDVLHDLLEIYHNIPASTIAHIINVTAEHYPVTRFFSTTQFYETIKSELEKLK